MVVHNVNNCPVCTSYFHKVPEEAPQLELKASYGLAEPLAFELPALSEQWSPEVLNTFDLTKGAKNDKVWATGYMLHVTCCMLHGATLRVGFYQDHTLVRCGLS